MPSLLSGLAGSSWSRSSGLLASSQITKSDIEPLALQMTPNGIGQRVGQFRIQVSGITKDSTGAVLGGCIVHLFRTSDDVELDQQVSDAITGEYAMHAYVPGQFYVVAYKAGAPDAAGTTVNTLVGA